MDSNIEVALMVKLLRLFPESDDEFLCFPRGTGFTYEELDFMEDPGHLTAEQLRQRNLHETEFARRLNMIPADEIVFSGDMSRFLWDEYKDVLNSSVVANNILSEKEQAQLLEAEEFLTDEIVEGEDRIQVYSIPVKKYYEFKTLSEEAERTYLDEKITVESSGDAKLQNDWETRREKELRTLKDRALNDWVNLGFKHQVEKYQAVKNNLGQKEPILYKQIYLNDLSNSHQIKVPGDEEGFYTTFYSPSNSFDTAQPWTTITMLKKEINALLRSAPQALKKFITKNQLNIESISLEYKRCVIIRPWFNKSWFTSRYWTLPDVNIIASDGAIPRQGKIPAFVTAMIVARKIEVVTKKTAGSVPPVKLGFLPKAMNFKAQMVGTSQPVIAQPAVKPAAKKPQFNAVKALAGVTVPKLNKFAVAKFAGTTVAAPTLIIPHKPIPKHKIQTESIALEGVAVIAFDCRRIAKSPNPDNTLEWPE